MEGDHSEGAIFTKTSTKEVTGEALIAVVEVDLEVGMVPEDLGIIEEVVGAEEVGVGEEIGEQK